LLREREGEFPTAVLRIDLFQGAGGVHMALYKVPVEAGGGEQGALQVDEGAYLPLVEGGFLEGFGYGSNAVVVVGDLFYGEAYAIMGYALVDFKLVGEGGLDPESFVGALG